MSGRPHPGRVLVTGASGFIGSTLVDALLARGHTVVGLDRRDPGHAANLAPALTRDAFVPVCADIATDELAGTFAGCDTVFHLAAVPGVRSSWGAGFERYAVTNVLGTQRVLDACVLAGVRRLVFASSSSVYGTVGGAPSRESDPVAPMSPYGVTKVAGEHLAGAYLHALSVVMLRYFTVYGPRQRPDMAIGRILGAALSGEPFTVYGDGSQRREFTYVDDVVAATIAAATAVPDRAVVNVGGGSSVTLGEVLELAADVTGRPVPVIWADPERGDVPVTRADLSLARRLLGYRPATGLSEGMRRQARWLRRSGGNLPVAAEYMSTN